MAKPCITDRLSNYGIAVRDLNKMLPDAMRVLAEMLNDDSKATRQWACELILKKALPDKQEIKDTTEKPVLLTQIEAFIKDGEKVG